MPVPILMRKAFRKHFFRPRRIEIQKTHRELSVVAHGFFSDGAVTDLFFRPIIEHRVETRVGALCAQTPETLRPFGRKQARRFLQHSKAPFGERLFTLAKSDAIVQRTAFAGGERQFILQQTAAGAHRGARTGEIFPFFQRDRARQPAVYSRKVIEIPLESVCRFGGHHKSVRRGKFCVRIVRKADDRTAIGKIFCFARRGGVIIKRHRISVHAEHRTRKNADPARSPAPVAEDDSAHFIRAFVRYGERNLRFYAAAFGTDGTERLPVAAAKFSDGYSARPAAGIPIRMRLFVAEIDNAALRLIQNDCLRSCGNKFRRRRTRMRDFTLKSAFVP